MAFFNQLDAMKLKVLITEMDVNDKGFPAEPIAARDEAVAATYGSYLRTMLDDPNVIAVLTWGITDRYTWLNYEDRRADGKPNRCLPFDAEFQAKPAFFAVREALLKAQTRHETGRY
jgi:endo-1,4-beta-xylanase